MEQRDKVTVWIAKRDYSITDYEAFSRPIKTRLNLVQMNASMLMQTTGQTDTGYATITYPKTRGDLLHTGDRIYLNEPDVLDDFALNADYEITNVIGKRIVVATARVMA